ncbi:MAG: CHASE4 domain-containing protein, partial [Chthoniobacterales bacterium]
MPGSIRKAERQDTALAVAGVAAAAFAFCSALFLSSSVTNDLEKLQRLYNRQRVQSVVQGVDQNEMHLIDYTKGYAMWDDTYTFLETRDPTYLTENYSESVMRVSPAELVAIYDLEGRMIFSAALDESGKTMPPPDGLKRFAKLEHFQQLKTVDSSLGRVEWIGDHPYLIAVCPVTDSAGTAPIRGYFLFGAVIGEKMLKRLENLTEVELSVSAEAEPKERG